MALRREDRDLTALTVLALLFIEPRHTYEMHRLMIDTHKDFVTGLPRSMYHAVDRLLRAELIEVVATEQEAGRPERTVYGLTDAGRVGLAERVRRLLATPDSEATLLVAALSYIGCLPVPGAIDALRERRDELARAHAAKRKAIAAATSVPRILLVEFEIARLAAERDWVAGLLTELETGRLGWPAPHGLELPGELPP
ncbi:helix-turn-helix transcriptional regulator [Streptomyces sp. NPDC020096]